MNLRTRIALACMCTFAVYLMAIGATTLFMAIGATTLFDLSGCIVYALIVISCFSYAMKYRMRYGDDICRYMNYDVTWTGTITSFVGVLGLLMARHYELKSPSLTGNLSIVSTCALILFIQGLVMIVLALATTAAIKQAADNPI